MWYMSSYKYLNKIYTTPQKFLTTKDLRDILEIKKERTFENAVRRLEAEKIIKKIEKGKYVKANSNYTDFEISQFIYNPSYISFETALNYYGLLEQFPYEITAVTTKKSIEKEFSGKSFSYSHMRKELFTGYKKEGIYLIAFPEKAIFDQIYMSIVGNKSEGILKDIKTDSFDINLVLRYTDLLSEKYRKAVTNKLKKIFQC